MDSPMIIRRMLALSHPLAVSQCNLGLKIPALVYGLATLAMAITFPAAAADTLPSSRPSITVDQENPDIWMSVGDRQFAMILDDSKAARAFAEMLPLTLNMADLNSNEKYADLQSPLPISVSNVDTINRGDVMLYGSKTLVIFYKTFQTSYSYTRIGRLRDPDELAKVLGRRSVQIEFTRAMPQSL
ncbi:cyclophilin-like fold protein [Pseudomonas sp. NPDC089996]|uniref:cyclophilin-like fold protein n=1 Tax=Pseudomonas sp. NPDC089996 TaxID=3364474 RepID=UPI003818DFEA